MTRNLNDILSSLSPERRNEIIARSKDIMKNLETFSEQAHGKIEAKTNELSKNPKVQSTVHRVKNFVSSILKSKK